MSNEQDVTYPSYQLKLQNGTTMTVGYHVSVGPCAAFGCSELLVWCDHGREDTIDSFILPSCHCDSPPMVCYNHRRQGFTCNECK